MAPLTEYEQQRLANIKKNQSLLSSLAIQAIGPSKHLKQASSSTTSTPSKKRSRPSTSESIVPPKRHATRASVRLSGIGLVEIKREEVVVEKVQERKRHEDRRLVAQSWRPKDETESTELTSGLLKCFSSSISTQPLKSMKQEEVNLDYLPGTDTQYDRLTEQLENMHLRSINKVCPNRIYSMAFHPDPQKSLLFVGERFGGVGIWDAFGSRTKVDEDDQDSSVSASPTHTTDPKPPKSDQIQETEHTDASDDEPELAEGRAYFIQAHTRYQAVSAIKPHPTLPHSVFTSSYDCTMRELNFETQQSSEVLDSEVLNPSEDTLLSAFEFANEGREIWCSDNAGGLSHRDLRMAKETASRWKVSKKKIGCVSLCPNSNDRLAATAGLNREMRLWDLQALLGLPTNSDLSLVESTACLVNYPHRLACSSAYFNHSGDKLLSTSYDDLIRVWEFDSSTTDRWYSSDKVDEQFKPNCQARHDNQTGRWVSVMRARWCPNPLFPSHFTVGNMTHKLDIYNSKGELLTQFRHHCLTTVPAVTAQHPTSLTNQIAGATAGGKVYLWI